MRLESVMAFITNSVFFSMLGGAVFVGGALLFP